MEELLRLLDEVEADLPITIKKLSDEMYNEVRAYHEDSYNSENYKGHHAFITSETIRDFFSIKDDNADVVINDYKGLANYQGDLSDTNFKFEETYNMLDVAYKTEHRIEGRHEPFDMNIPVFHTLINSAFGNLNLMEVMSPGEYFYMFNALKKVREEYIDDYI